MNILTNAIDALEESLFIWCHCVASRAASGFPEAGDCEVSSVEASDVHLSLIEDFGQITSPTIWIHTEVLGSNRVAIRIADNGPGITEEVQKRMFDPFFTTKPAGKGTGLGMSISYQIVTERHNGSLYCSSSPGKGAEFVLEIPIQQLKLSDRQQLGWRCTS